MICEYHADGHLSKSVWPNSNFTASTANVCATIAGTRNFFHVLSPCEKFIFERLDHIKACGCQKKQRFAEANVQLLRIIYGISALLLGTVDCGMHLRISKNGSS